VPHFCDTHYKYEGQGAKGSYDSDCAGCRIAPDSLYTAAPTVLRLQQKKMNARTKLARALVISSMISLTAVLLAGCGEVVVFGHTVREGKHESGAEAGPGAPAETSPAPSASSTATAATQSTSSPSVAAKTSAQPATSGVLKLHSVSVALTTEAAAKAKEDTKFDANALLSAIRSELQSRKVLDESDSQASATGEITIDEYAFNPTTNVILFGKTYNAGVLNGAIRVNDAQGNELSNRRIEARTKIAIPVEGEVVNPLRPLYQDFASQTANILTGTSAKTDDSDQWRPR
jgi:hypothetical protein